MIYVMSKRMYKEYRKKLTHGKVLEEINRNFGLSGEITKIQLK